MEIEPDFVVTDYLSSQFEQTFRRFMEYSDKSFEAEMKNQAALFVIDAMKVTPPFHQGRGQGITAAKHAGEDAISRRIGRIFVGLELVGSRKISHLFGKPHPNAPWVVPAPEKYPDVEGIYAAEKAKARHRGRMRFIGPPLTVDRQKVRKIYRAEIKKVGWLAGGWHEAAKRLGAGAKVPAFVRRHSAAPGQVIIDFKPTSLRVVLENQVKYADYVGGLQKRVTFALLKRYISGAQSWTRAIAKPVGGTVRLALNGVEQMSGWSVDTATGSVTFTTAPGAGVAITAGFEFDVPVRFDSDMLDVTLDLERLGSITSIPLLEIRR